MVYCETSLPMGGDVKSSIIYAREMTRLEQCELVGARELLFEAAGEGQEGKPLFIQYLITARVRIHEEE